MHDIQDREDIITLVNSFYKKVMVDDTIHHFFTVVSDFSWDVHIPIMIIFWETILFTKVSYKGNPMIKHIELDKLSKMEPHHFEQWLRLWKETLSENFSGEKADEAYARAVNIATMMQYKINSKFSL